MARTVIDATTAEHAQGGIGVVIRGLLEGVETLGLGDDVVVLRGPNLDVPGVISSLTTRMVGTRYGRLAYQRLLVAADWRVKDVGASRLLAMDSYIPLIPVPGLERRDCFIHDVLPITHPHYFSRARLVPKRIGLASARSATTAFTSSLHTAEQIRRCLGIEARPVRFGCGQLSDAQADASLAEKLEPRHGYFLYVGAIEERKDLRTLVEAIVDSARRSDNATRLAIVGNHHTQEGRRIREWAKTVAGDQVRFLGKLGGAETRQLIRRATALVYPSQAEGFGLPVLEGMALGTPVVASAIPEIQSWAGDACLYFSPGDSRELARTLEAVSGCSGRAATARGLALSEEYRWRKFAAELLGA